VEIRLAAPLLFVAPHCANWSHPMTLVRVLTVGALVVGIAGPASAGDWQRARARPESSGDAPTAEAPAARAVPRPQEERRAVERPSPPQDSAAASVVPAPAPALKDSAPARETPRRDSRPTGPTFVTPSFSTPVSVGGVQVGEPFIVGNAFTVGHVAKEPDDDRFRRRDDGDRRSRYSEVVVPVYVPVPVEVYTDTDSGVAEDSAVAPTASSSLRDLARGSDAVRDRRSQSERRSSSYFRFVPWFNVGNALTAGVPVPLPSPEMFDERNVSEKVLIETEDASRASGVRREYALGVGGLAFAIKPADAAVYIDGYFVGSAYDFGPDREPLLLRNGSYTLELRAEGFVIEKFPVYVTMGEVLPFSGSLVKSD